MVLSPFSFRPRRKGRIPDWQMALLLIAFGALGRLLLWDLPNVETILVVALLAGMLLGGIYVVIVPVAAMVLTDVLTYLLGWSGAYSPIQVFGLGLFVYSGFVAAAAMGAGFRPKVLFRTRAIAVMTSLSIPATLLFDLWTAFGDWFLISRHPPFGWSFLHVLELQVPFTLVHIASSLLFVPLFGSMFTYLHVNGWPSSRPVPEPLERLEGGPSEEGLELLPHPPDLVLLPVEVLLPRLEGPLPRVELRLKGPEVGLQRLELPGLLRHRLVLPA